MGLTNVAHALAVSLKAASIADGFFEIVQANVSINTVSASRARTNLWSR